LNSKGLGAKSLKDMDCGLISRKWKGLSEKWLDFDLSMNCFLEEIPWTESTSLWTDERVWSTMDHDGVNNKKAVAHWRMVAQVL
jgi:hypothetical protein